MNIGIIAIYENKDGKGHFYINENFKNIFEELDITLIPIVSAKRLDEIVEICDGVIIPGNGIDIHSKYYNEAVIDEHTKLAEYNDFELDKPVIEAFHNKNKKMLGICAGLQSINVCFGGTLNQHIENHNLANRRHNLNISKDSILYRIYNQEQIQVNSTHHQSIKNVAPGFKVIATSDDGIIEAIQKESILGVQWHPEKLHDIKFFKDFFEV